MGAKSLNHSLHSDLPGVTIIVPCYNEEVVIMETARQLREFCSDLPLFDFEIIFIDDGSSDQTRALLKRLSFEDSRIKIIGLARNFGHQVAVTAGIDASSGDAVVLVDADLQDPPRVISIMIDKWREGYDVVYGVRIERHGESAFKRATAHIFYRFLNSISDVSIPSDTGDFRLMSKNVVNTLRAMPERDRFIRGMVSWVGFKQIGVPYSRAERFAGESKYPLGKMIRFAIDGILSFSTKPLQMSVSIGILSSILALLSIFYVLKNLKKLCCLMFLDLLC
jgi:dolichol-phosphate mannosyltransferase